MNKSFGSFLDRFDIQQAFQVVTVEVTLYSNIETTKLNKQPRKMERKV